MAAIDESTATGVSFQLTDEQKQQVQSILSSYDANNLTTSDAQSIFKQFLQAGIPPGKDLKDTIQASGFNADQLASLADPHGGQAQTGNSSQGEGVNTSALQNLWNILNQYDLKNMSADQQKGLLSKLDQAGLLQGGGIINIGV